MDLLARLASWVSRTPPIDEHLRQAIDRGVAIAEPLIKVVPHYDKKLAATTRDTLSYCFKLANDIPGPIDINSRAFRESSLVHAIFSGTEQIRDMFGKSQSVREFLAHSCTPQADEVFALLGMRRHEKQVMGLGVYGEQVRSEVPQTMLYFSDHTLLSLSTDLEKTRTLIGDLAFDSLARGFAGMQQELRKAKQDLHSQWEIARATAGHREHQVFDQHDLEQRLQHANKNLLPEHVLDAYQNWLANRTSNLRLDWITLSVDRMGVLGNAVMGQDWAGDTISFPELVARDRRHWIVMLVRIHKEEVMQAREATQEATRYLVI